MTNVVLTKSGVHYDLLISGHAGYSSDGNDIVCSACSILSYSAIQELFELDAAGCICITEHEMCDGIMRVAFDVNNVSALIAVNTVMHGYQWLSKHYEKNISFQYPKGMDL